MAGFCETSFKVNLHLLITNGIYFKAKASGPPAVGEKTAKASTPASRPAKFGGKEYLSNRRLSKISAS
jgi:hypothetical protein